MKGGPRVAVDVVIFTIDDGALKALLVQPKTGPYARHWAFPGGLLRPGEDLEHAARRQLREQTGIQRVYLEQLQTFGSPQRDRNAHVVSVAYFALLPQPGETPSPQSKYAGVRWSPLRRLPPLAYDHNDVATYALQRLRSKLGYTNIVYGLLPRAFTLGDLQHVYEIILGKQLDRRNFRKKLLASKLLRKAAGLRRGPHRPAQLYSFVRRAPTYVALL